MKYTFYSLIGFILAAQASLANSSDLGVLGNSSGITSDKLRNGDIHTSDIPKILVSTIDFFMGIAGTIAIIFVIIGAYKILLGSLQQDKTKGKDTIMMALIGFALAALSWFIVRLIIDNFA